MRQGRVSNHGKVSNQILDNEQENNTNLTATKKFIAFQLSGTFFGSILTHMEDGRKGLGGDRTLTLLQIAFTA